jgi:hypothetical protein
MGPSEDDPSSAPAAADTDPDDRPTNDPASTPTQTTEAAVAEPVTSIASAPRTVLLLWLTGIALALVVSSAPLVAWSWWGARAILVVPLGLFALAVLGALAWGSPDRSGPLVIVGLAVVATVVAVTGMWPIGQGESLPGEEDHVVGRFERLMGSDIPTAGAYAVTAAAVLLTLVGIILTVLGLRGRAEFPLLAGGRTSGRERMAALATTAVVVGIVGVIGHGAQGVADRRAHAEVVTRIVTQPAERLERAPGPDRIERVAWEAPAADAEAPDEALSTGVAVPGWDVVVTLGDRRDGPDPTRTYGDEDPPVAVVARAKTDGSELWTYQRHDHGQYRGVAVDPEAGRVLLLTAGAVIVLDLRDGSQEVTRALPDDLRAAHIIEDGSFPYPMGGSYMSSVGPDVVVGSFFWDEGPVAVLDVVTGEVRDRHHVDGRCGVQAVADPDPPSSADGPVIVQWGFGDGCDTQSLLRLDTDGHLVETAVEIPADADDSLVCDRCYSVQIMTHGDLVVIETANDENVYGGDVVALSPEGEVLWRASETMTTEQPNPYIDPMAVSDRGVVVWAEGRWRLLDADDGSEVATRQVCDGYESTVADAERLYLRCDDGIAVIELATLELVSLGGRPATWDAAYISDGHLVAITSHGDIDRIVSLTADDAGARA